MYIADECFLTGTAAEVIPVVKVDSRTIGDGTPGPVTRDLMRAIPPSDAELTATGSGMTILEPIPEPWEVL